MPDRFILMPDGWACFVELKQAGEKPRDLQRKQIREIEKRKFPVYVVAGDDELKQWAAEHLKRYAVKKAAKRPRVLDYPH